MSRPVPQIIEILRADAGVIAVIGNRVYADHPPQDDLLPFAVIGIQHTQAWPTVNNCQVKAYVCRIALDILCGTRGESEAAQEALEDALCAIYTADPTHPIQGIVVDSGVAWDVINPIDGSDERGYHASQEFNVNFKRLN